MRSDITKTTLMWAVIAMCSFAIAENKWGYIGFNTSASLPYSVYLVIRGKDVAKEDYAAFLVPNNPFFKPGTVFVKRVAGVPGDRIYQKDNVCFVNDKKTGKILHETKNGQKLQPSASGQLSEGMYFMAGDHERSFDSRYKEMDWIHETTIIGRAYPIF